MLRNVASLRRPLTEHQDRNDASRSPPQLPSNLSCQSRLDVEASEGVLRVAERRLDLDHGERRGWCMPGKNVDPSSVSVVVEAHLDADDPSPCLEHQDKPILEGGVSRIEQPRKPLALPEDLDAQISAKLVNAPLDLARWNVVDPIVLDPRDQLT